MGGIVAFFGYFAGAVAFFVGFGRLAATWSMLEELPDRFQGDGTRTPWGGDFVVMR